MATGADILDVDCARGLKNCKMKKSSVSDSLLKIVHTQIKYVYAHINVHAF